MKRAVLPLVAAAAILASAPAIGQERQFDANLFRPSGAPRDLVMVQKSEIIGNLSPVVGLYTELIFNPLVLIDTDNNQKIHAIGAGLTFTPVAGIGFFNLFDVTAAIPLVAWQTGDNLRPLGTEGPVASNAVGDLRLQLKFGIPGLNRKSEIKSGFGMAVAAQVNLPTGNPAAFTGDGAVTGGPMLIFDYRWSFGLLVAANTGLWLRPKGEYGGVGLGDMASVGIGAEQYVIQRWGISVIADLYGYPSLTKLPTSAADIPVEALVGIRWQSKYGITITTGGSFGAACGFGSPSFELWNSITWQPSTSREQDEINRILQRESDDPDGDGLIGDADHCPNEPGPPENLGCPDIDTDGDGVPDRLDECPDLPQGPGGKNGCPVAYLKGDEIMIAEQVHFATDKDIILDESKPALGEVALVLINHPEIRELRIEGHTDIRASDAYNINLSQRRVNSVQAFLVGAGVDPSRLTAKGYGHTSPVYDDTGCLGPDETLTPACRTMTSKNRRVVFRVVHRGAPPPRALTGAPDGNGSVLPTKGGALPSSGDKSVLPSQGVLGPGKTVLPSTGVLPEPGQNKGLPTTQKKLPSTSVLPRQGTTAPKKDAPPTPPATPPPPAPPPAPPPN
jgi:OmpA-OmpF porin, OOP family